MSLSIQKIVSDGTLSTVVLGIEYLQRNDIYMHIGGVETPQSGAPSGYTWSFLDNNTIRVLPVVPAGVEVVVYRRTDLDAMYNIYSQNAQFDENTIDENNQQLLYIAQEYFEQGVQAQLVEGVEYVHEDTVNMYYRLKLSGDKYTAEFPIPKGGAAGFDALRRTYLEAGLNLVVGSFETGGVLRNPTDVLLHNVTAKAYAWSGVFPKVVASGSTPTPLGSGGWFDRTNLTLRSEISDIDGAGLIGSMSYAQLRAYSGPQTTVNVWGISNVFDGAAGTFKINTSDTTSADNGGTILVDASGRRWYRQYYEDISTRWFGSQGNDSADDTAAISAALSASDGVVRLPEGTHKITATLMLNKRLIGAGVGLSILKNYSSSNIIDIGNGTDNPSYVEVSGISFDYSAQQTLATQAVRVRNGRRIKINNNSYSSRCGVALDLNGGANQYEYNVTDQEINGSVIGVRYGADGTILQGVWADKIEAYGCTQAGQLINGISGSFLSNIDNVMCHEGVVLAPLVGKRIIATWFNNVLADSSDNAGWRLTAAPSSAILECTFNSCWASSNGRITTSDGFHVDNSGGSIDGLQFNGGQFYENKGAGLVFHSGNNYSLTGVSATGNSQAASNVSHGAYFSNVSGLTITGGKYGVGGDFVASQNTGIFIDTTVSNYAVNFPDCTGNVTLSVKDASRKGVVKAIGYTNANDRGTGAVAIGTNVTTITPGFTGGFSGAEIQITPRSSLSASGITSWYMNWLSTTQFQVITNANVTEAGFIFGWQIKN